MSFIETAVNEALKIAGVRPVVIPRFRLTDERLATLRKIHGDTPAFLRLTHNLHGAGNYRVKNAIEGAIRNWVPEELGRKWADRDARANMPVINGVRFNPHNPRAPFNQIRVIA